MKINLFNKLRRRFRPATNSAESVLVEIYSKPDCHLCEEAKATLLKMRRRYGFQLREVNVANEAALLDEYGTRIPLIFVDGRLVCKYVVDEAALVKSVSFAEAI